MKKRQPPYKSSKEKKIIADTAYGEKCSLDDLKKGQCKWPVGDPRHKDFGFCAGLDS
jgi:hypothetical protein